MFEVITVPGIQDICGHPSKYRLLVEDILPTHPTGLESTDQIL